MNSQDELTMSMDARPISWKKWVTAFLIFLLCCAAVLLVARGTPRLANVEILILYLLYMSVAFTFLPLPTAWIVLWAAREVEPLSVALIGTVGTCIANLHDYYIIHYLFRVDRIKKAKKTKFYQGAVRWFDRAPFVTLTAASFLPIPIDVVRILAVSTDYPRAKYALATFAGRFPRYLLLAYLGYELQLSNKAIFIVFLVTAAIGILKGLSKLREKYKGGGKAALLLVPFLLIPVASPADEPTLDDVLARHCAAREAASTLKADFLQTKVFTLFDEEETSEGELYFAQPDRICWQYSKPDRSSTVISGKLGWSVFPDIKQVQKFELKGSQTNKVLSIVGFGKCGAPLSDSFEIVLGKGDKHSFLLNMTPTDEDVTPYFSRVDLTLDRSDYLPRSIELVEKSGDILRFEFSNLKRDIKLDNTIFEYAIPRGYEVVEY